MAVPVFQSILNCEPDNGSFLQMNSNCGCDNPIEELLESYLAFTERRYMNAGEVNNFLKQNIAVDIMFFFFFKCRCLRP